MRYKLSLFPGDITDDVPISFDMYGESEQTSGSLDQSGSSAVIPSSESGQALEVVELSNGEVIWSVVDAMRGSDLGLDEDEISSIYAGRQSVESDYSGKSPDVQDDVQIFFREHKRMASKGSTSSTLSKKKIFAATATRPETKVRNLALTRA